MEKHTFLFEFSVADLSWLWFKKLFTQSGTLGFSRSLGRAHVVRLGDIYNKRLSYQSPYREIQVPSYVDNRRLEVAERAKNVKITAKYENGSNSGVEGSSTASGCSISSMKPPPNVNPARRSKSHLFSSKTPETCGAEDGCVSVDTQSESFVHNSNRPSSGKGLTEARGSVPVSSSSSNGDSGCKETPFGGPGNDLCTDTSRNGLPYAIPPEKLEIGSDLSKDLSDVYSVGNSNTSLDELGGDSGVEGSSVGSSCSISSMDPPLYMSPARISDVELFSSKTASSDVCSVGDSGGEEFKHPAPGRTTTGHGCHSRSLSFPYNINIDPFGEKPGSDQWVFSRIDTQCFTLGTLAQHAQYDTTRRTGIKVQGV